MKKFSVTQSCLFVQFLLTSLSLKTLSAPNDVLQIQELTNEPSECDIHTYIDNLKNGPLTINQPVFLVDMKKYQGYCDIRVGSFSCRIRRRDFKAFKTLKCFYYVLALEKFYHPTGERSLASTFLKFIPTVELWITRYNFYSMIKTVAFKLDNLVLYLSKTSPTKSLTKYILDALDYRIHLQAHLTAIKIGGLTHGTQFFIFVKQIIEPKTATNIHFLCFFCSVQTWMELSNISQTLNSHQMHQIARKNSPNAWTLGKYSLYEPLEQFSTFFKRSSVEFTKENIEVCIFSNLLHLRNATSSPSSNQTNFYCERVGFQFLSFLQVSRVTNLP